MSDMCHVNCTAANSREQKRLKQLVFNLSKTRTFSYKLLKSTKTTILVIMFSDFLMFYQIFLSPQMK